MVILSMSYFKLSVISAFFVISGFAFSESANESNLLSVDSEIGFISDEFYVPLKAHPVLPENCS